MYCIFILILLFDRYTVQVNPKPSHSVADCAVILLKSLTNKNFAFICSVFATLVSQECFIYFSTTLLFFTTYLGLITHEENFVTHSVSYVFANTCINECAGEADGYSAGNLTAAIR